METNINNLWDWTQAMSEKYPNEKLWNVFGRKIMQYRDTFDSIRRTLTSIERETQRDIKLMNDGYEPMAISLVSEATKFQDLREEMRGLASECKSFIYILEMQDEDVDLFWTLANEAMKFGGK